MTLHLIDGRFAQLRVVPETVALDYANDISALAAQAHHHLNHLDSGGVMKVSDAIFEIHGTARKWAGFIEEAPSISPDQLDMALCPDGRRGAPHGRAA